MDHGDLGNICYWVGGGWMGGWSSDLLQHGHVSDGPALEGSSCVTLNLYELVLLSFGGGDIGHLRQKKKKKGGMTSFSYLFEENSRSKVNLKNVWISATMTFISTYSFILIFCLMLIAVSFNHAVIFRELIWSRALITSAVSNINSMTR